MVEIAPSILSADFSHLKKEVDLLNSSDADYLHLDIMDGVFVPNISFGFPICETIVKHARVPLDYHLMIIKPENYIQQCIDLNAKIITVHLEGSVHLHRTVELIKKAGVKAGIAINPHTPIDALFEIIPHIDIILVMSVNPGFGNQKFIDTSYGKIRRLKKLIQSLDLNVKIEVDGGVNLGNAQKLVKGGADILVSGTAILKSDDPKKYIQDLKNYPTKRLLH